jgi:peptidoglycan/LPS O-acetylase OafA/YrhL
MAAETQKPALQIPSLDGLRALSFGLVFVGHAGLEIVPAGLGVTLFFFLSGYLITTLLRLEWEHTATVAFGKFYLRRVLRILPPFYIVLTTALLLASFGVLEHRWSAGALWGQFGHYTNYFIIRNGYDGLIPGTAVYWSLAVEEHYYVAFPALFFLLRKLGCKAGTQAAVFASLCALILAWRCALVSGGAVSDRTYLASDTRVDSIFFGAIMAVYRNPVLDANGIGRGKNWLRLGFPLGVAVLLGTLAFRNPTFRETIRYSIQGLALMPIFGAAIAHPNAWCFRLLSTKPLRFVGTLSYSLYLTHHLIIFGLAHHLGSIGAPLRALLAGALAFGFAWLLHVAVEKPCAKLRKRLHG